MVSGEGLNHIIAQIRILHSNYSEMTPVQVISNIGFKLCNQRYCLIPGIGKVT